MLKPALYEQIISQSLSRELASVSDACKHVEKLDAAEAPRYCQDFCTNSLILIRTCKDHNNHLLR